MADKVRISIYYRIFNILMISLLILAQSIWPRETVLNPFFVFLIMYAVLLFFRKLTYQDEIFLSLFSASFLLFIPLSLTLNYFIAPNNNLIIYEFYIIILGLLWGFNNPEIIWKIFSKNVVFYNISPYLAAFLCFIGIGFSFIFSFLGMSLENTTNFDSLKIILECISILLAFNAGNLGASFLIIIKRLWKNIGIINDTKILISQVENKNTKTGFVYKFLLLVCFFYIVTLPVSAYVYGISSAAAAFPILLGAGYFIFKLSQKKYDYETTIIFSNRVLIFIGLMFLISIVTFAIFSNYELFFNDIKNFRNNIWLFSENFNNNFYLAYTFLVFVLLGAALSLNNLSNCYNAFLNTRHFNYTPFRSFLFILLFLLISFYFLSIFIGENTGKDISYYSVIVILLSYTSAISARFLGYYIFLVINSFNKGKKYYEY